MGIDLLPQRADGNFCVAAVACCAPIPFLIPVPRGASLWESGKGFELVDETETKDGSRQLSHALPGYALRRDRSPSRGARVFSGCPKFRFGLEQGARLLH